MQTGIHTAVRTTEPDDAEWLLALYRRSPPHAALLDGRREPVLVNEDELREALGKRDAQHRGTFYTIESSETGDVIGFCSVRSVALESGFGEVSVLFLDSADYASPAGEEAARFLRERAFDRQRLHKTIAHCLPSETAYRAWLACHGFTLDGAYRDALYAAGEWHSVESWTCFAASPAAQEN